MKREEIVVEGAGEKIRTDDENDRAEDRQFQADAEMLERGGGSDEHRRDARDIHQPIDRERIFDPARDQP